MTFDLAISYTWKYDKEFVDLTEEIFHRNGLSTFIIGKFNVQEVKGLIRNKEIRFKAYLDRASDEDPEFLPLARMLTRSKCLIINPHKKVIKAIDKSAMHRKLLKKRFSLPKTFLIPSYNQKPGMFFKGTDMAEIGVPFVIKPAVVSGGGEGVIKNAVSIAEVQNERLKSPNEKYLIQEKIIPKTIGGRRAWFRVLCAFDHPIATWWDDQTHIYKKVTKRDIQKYNLLPLIRITSKLSRITRLDYFSTEIALTKDHKFVMIDYINDQCDMRLKSNHPDGVPDNAVVEFLHHMRKKIVSL